MSQPSWAAWIEILTRSGQAMSNAGRSPLGLRGLKYNKKPSFNIVIMSQPSWAAWIEIPTLKYLIKLNLVAALLGCVD